MRVVRINYLVAIVSAAILLTGCPANDNPPPKVPATVVSFLRTSAEAGVKGDELQSRSDWPGALEQYESVVTAGDNAIKEYQQLNTPLAQQHWLAYFLPARG